MGIAGVGSGVVSYRVAGVVLGRSGQQAAGRGKGRGQREG
jgi:hypothetical protein